MVTCSEVDIAKPSLIHALLHSQVEHRFFFSILNARHTCHIRLSIISTHILHHIYRQVLQASSHIASEELLAIHHNLRDALAVDLYIAFRIHLGTRHLSHQLFEHGTFGYPIGSCVVHQRIAYRLHLGHLGCHHSLRKQFAVWLQRQLSDIDFFTRIGCEPERSNLVLITYIGDPQDIVSHGCLWQDEVAIA